jgi:hypothetical protein
VHNASIRSVRSEVTNFGYYDEFENPSIFKSSRLENLSEEKINPTTAARDIKILYGDTLIEELNFL